MKCVLVLVTVHLCYAIGIHANLNSEMLHSLRALKTLTEFTFNNSVRAPEAKMRTNASCWGVFKRELTNVLDNVRNVPEAEVYVLKLRANLVALGSHKENDSICPFKHLPKSKATFEKYIKFLQKLNSKG